MLPPDPLDENTATFLHLLSGPVDGLSLPQLALAVDMVTGLARTLTEPDVDMLLADRHVELPCTPASYLLLLDYLRDEEGLSAEVVRDWRDRFALELGGDDPRVQAFQASRRAMLDDWRVSSARCAQLLADFTSTPAEEVDIVAWGMESGRHIWRAGDACYYVFLGDERRQMAMQYVSHHPTVALRHPEVLATTLGVEDVVVQAWIALFESEPELVHNEIWEHLLERRLDIAALAAAVIDSTEDWVTFLSGGVATDGVEYRQDDVSLVRVLDVTPEFGRRLLDDVEGASSLFGSTGFTPPGSSSDDEDDEDDDDASSEPWRGR
jgi:hypothetical protein